MEVVIDPDVKAVADFMERAVPAGKRMGVANRLAEISSLLWGHLAAEDVAPMQLQKIAVIQTAIQAGVDRVPPVVPAIV